MISRRMLDFPTWGFEPQSPLTELERMRREMDRLFEVFRAGTPFTGTDAGVFPLVNLTEDADNYYVRAELPAMKTTDLNLQTAGNTLTISGERKISEQEAGGNFHRRERQAGRFSRVLSLPAQIASHRIEASLTEGILTVVVPKAEEAKPRQITVK